jgi:hypothetical protein
MTRTQADIQSTEIFQKALSRYSDAGIKGGREMESGSGYVNHVPGAKKHPERQWQPGIQTNRLDKMWGTFKTMIFETCSWAVGPEDVGSARQARIESD